ncbi:MAG: efflux RND transporter periplasmic adaptor subunit [Sphingobacteriaceae bacterium]|nr:efflux RND transporter periplasmic adaptor subunit [Sphingobacteriaceae bacterium]
MKKILFIGAIAFLSACSEKAKDKKAELVQLKKEQVALNAKISALENEVGSQETAVKEVAVYEVNPSVFKNYLEIQGKIDAEENLQVTPEAAGLVSAVFVKIGQSVKKGQVIAQIDDKVLRQSMAEIQTQIDLANNLYNRQKNLWDQKIGTEVQFISAKTQKESAERRMETTKSQLALYKIKSPINGIIDAMDLKVGQTVMPGFSGVRVVNANNLKAKAMVSESYAGRIMQGGKVNVILPDAADSLQTSISYASKTIDPVSRSYEIEVKLPSNKKYQPNMLALLKITDYNNSNALVVPISAILKSESESYVYLFVDGIATKSVIKIGKTSNGKAEILSGIKTGDKIIVTGIQDLNEGDKVKF